MSTLSTFILLPSEGRLADAAESVFKSHVKNVIPDRKLSYQIEALNMLLHIQQVRSNDIPRLIAGGYGDFGLTGLDYVQETEDINVCVSLAIPTICNSHICLLVAKDANLNITSEIPQNSLVVSQYPRIATDYFKKIERPDIRIYPITGAAEGYVANGFAYGCIDVVETGVTAKANNLKILSTLFETHAVLISNIQIDNRKETTQRCVDLFRNLL